MYSYHFAAHFVLLFHVITWLNRTVCSYSKKIGCSSARNETYVHAVNNYRGTTFFFARNQSIQPQKKKEKEKYVERLQRSASLHQTARNLHNDLATIYNAANRFIPFDIKKKKNYETRIRRANQSEI